MENKQFFDPIGENFKSEKARDLAYLLADVIVAEENFFNIDECIISLGLDVARKMSLKAGYPIESILIAEYKDQLRKSQSQSHYITDINPEDQNSIYNQIPAIPCYIGA